MKTNLKISQGLLAGIDLINTLGGGRSLSSVRVDKRSEGYEVLVKAPGVEADSLQIDVVEGRLWVYQLHPVLARQDQEKQSDDESLGYLPNTLTNLVLPHDVDAEHISAKYEKNHWKVFLPFNDVSHGYARHVDIEQ